MSSRSLSREVAQFVRDHIHSVEQLEVLLLLRTDPVRAWTPGDVARELRTNESSVEARLGDLHATHLVTRTEPATPTDRPRFTYAPATPELTSAVDALASAYGEMRYRVIEQILSKPTDKVRLFADAFRLRRKEEDDDG